MQNKNIIFRWSIGASIQVYFLLLPLKLLSFIVFPVSIAINILKRSLGRDFYVCFTESHLYFGKLNKNSYLDLSKAEFCEPSSNNNIRLRNTFPKVISIPYFFISEVKLSKNGRDLIILTDSSKVRIRIKTKDKELILRIHEEFKTRLGYKFNTIENDCWLKK